jgi:hypothetical protein
MCLPDWPPPWDHKIKRYLQLDGQGEAEARARVVWQEALSLIKPGSWHGTMTIDEFLRVFEPHARASQALGRLLKGSGRVVLMAVSLGPRLEEKARELLSQRKAFAGFMLDRMGSYLAEGCMSSLDRQVAENLVAEGWQTTRRYSPGYQDFSLEAQKVFVELSSSAMPMLKLGPGNSLVPIKSITALKGARSSS